MTENLNLDNYQFTEYIKQAMLDYFELENISGIEVVLIEKIKDDTTAKVQLLFVESCQRYLNKKFGLNEFSPEMMDLMTNARSFNIGADVFLKKDSGLKLMIGDAVDKMDEMCELLQFIDAV